MYSIHTIRNEQLAAHLNYTTVTIRQKYNWHDLIGTEAINV